MNVVLVMMVFGTLSLPGTVPMANLIVNHGRINKEVGVDERKKLVQMVPLWNSCTYRHSGLYTATVQRRTGAIVTLSKMMMTMMTEMVSQ
jgi:hypothetical protein